MVVGSGPMRFCCLQEESRISSRKLLDVEQ